MVGYHGKLLSCVNPLCSAEIFAPEAKSPCSLANKTTGIATTVSTNKTDSVLHANIPHCCADCLFQDVNTDQQISLEPLPPERKIIMHMYLQIRHTVVIYTCIRCTREIRGRPCTTCTVPSGYCKR